MEIGRGRLVAGDRENDPGRRRTKVFPVAVLEFLACDGQRARNTRFLEAIYSPRMPELLARRTVAQAWRLGHCS